MCLRQWCPEMCLRQWRIEMNEHAPAPHAHSTPKHLRKSAFFFAHPGPEQQPQHHTRRAARERERTKERERGANAREREGEKPAS